ncbi:hypothetical protein [Candidatus Odyssella acanthamoebae]|uniref:Uncharacterized protein n=1 Tax=Candidatus Odyssella acanthamoebae TaxID=91604 RepID=A0A077AUM7_9PROT|nr:hypothetical protein [Candidatus Paracaedibacter acanthamoebae]AIK95734.1 hypothetical protein ID47_01765 [Candidatus Paracaedibacter acanthamoebae]
MKAQATQKIILAYLGLITFSQSTQFEKLSVAQTIESTTVTLRANIPTAYSQPRLTNCISRGTSLSCDMQTKNLETSLLSVEGLVPHIISVTLPYRADVWQVNINYHGHYYKTGG